MSKQKRRGKRRNESRPPRIITRSANRFDRIPEAHTALRLECEACRISARYDVGTVLFSPSEILEGESPLEAMQRTFGFTRYVRCRRCDAGGPWRLSNEAATLVAILVMAGPGRARAEGCVYPAKSTLFDGTIIRFPTEGEAHLRRLIQETPHDPLLRDRLGNLFLHSGRPDLAFEAFREALAIDPGFLPSLHSVGELYNDEGRVEEAAESFHALLRAARLATTIRLEERRAFVRSALDALFELHDHSDGRVPVLPPPAALSAEAGGGDAKPATLMVTSFDLSREKDWRRLVELFANPTAPRRGSVGARAEP